MAKIFCEKCKKKCRGEVLRVADKYFHKGCFTCSKCNKSLQTGGFFINEDSFYCQEDYQRYFVEKCRVCARELVGEIVTVSNHSFHRECFKCTSCYVNFHPGDRVTIWHERFFCPRCIGQECVIVPSCSQLTPKLNGISLSPTSITDDEGCISAVDASLSEFASPQAGSVPTTNGRSKSVQLRSIEEFPWNSSQSKCITSNEQPQKSKSILRKSGQDHTVDRLALRENSHLSADSGVGDRLCESKTSEDPIHVPLYSEQMNGGNVFSPSNVLSPTGLSSSHHSRQSLSTRVPNSDYGRLLNQSYIHLDPTSPTSPDGYKRNVSFSTVTSCAKPKHFHIPEAKSRFLPVGVRTHSILFSRSTSSNTMPQTSTPRPKQNLTRQVEHPPQMTRSSIELSRKSYSDKSSDHDRTRSGFQGPRVNGSHANPSRSDEQEITGEARRLACFPAGQERNKTLPAPIERYDWPAPPASAVILAELMRERRCRRREQARLNGTLADDGVDYESQEALSIDCSYDGVTTAQGNTSVHQTSGIGQAILREEAEQKRRCRSHQFLDPVSASRSPNAAVEPLFKPRYSTHQFVCRPIRPGYTGGRLFDHQKTASLPASTLLLNSRRMDSSTSGWQLRNIRHSDQTQPSSEALSVGRSLLSPENRPYYHSVHTLSPGQSAMTGSKKPLDNRGVPVVQNGDVDSTGDLLGSSRTHMLSYPNVHYPPTPSAAFYKSAPPAPKIIPYEQLKTFRIKPPKGIDRTALEAHLSEEEFQSVFHLSPAAFYRLPEWKRNDLKRRAELF